MDASVPFKVFGLQRTGTNLMRALLSLNFRVEYLEESASGWKHGPLRLPGGMWNGKPARFVHCVKNPYSWAVSCYRFFRASHGSDPTMAPQFQVDPTMSFEEFVITPSYSFPTPIDRWNQMNRLWLNTLPCDRTLLVRQEDQFHQQLQILQDAERKLQLHRNADRLQPIEQRVDVDAKRHGPMNRNYYLDRQYLAEYSPTLLERVNALVDPSLMRQFGYRLERWTLEERQIGPFSLLVRPCTSDAVEALEAASDPFRLLEVKRAGEEVHTIVDANAALGAFVLYAKGLWPGARVTALESSFEQAAMLRSNVQHLPDVCVYQTGNLDHEGQIAPVTSSPPAEVDVGLGSVLDQFEEVSLLHAGPGNPAMELLGKAMADGVVRKVRRICLRLSGEPHELEVVEGLARTHTIERRVTPSGTFVTATRLGP